MQKQSVRVRIPTAKISPASDPKAAGELSAVRDVRTRDLEREERKKEHFIRELLFIEKKEREDKTGKNSEGKGSEFCVTGNCRSDQHEEIAYVDKTIQF